MVVQVVQLILALHYELGVSEQRLGACDVGQSARFTVVDEGRESGGE